MKIASMHLALLLAIATLTAMTAHIHAAVKIQEPPVALSGGNATWLGKKSSDFQDPATWNSPPTAGPNRINFADGNGEFRQTCSGKISFLGSNDAGKAYINFDTGSKGQLSLAGVASREYFNGLVKQSWIKVDDQGVYDPVKVFQFAQDGEQAEYSPKPERLQMNGHLICIDSIAILAMTEAALAREPTPGPIAYCTMQVTSFTAIPTLSPPRKQRRL